jgi:U3 small nucleolar RNA-associated protein 3
MARKANTRKSSRKASQPEDLSEYNNPVDDFSEQRERRMEAKLHTGDTDDEDDIMAQVDNEYEIKGDVDFEESNDVRTKKSSKSKKAASAAASSAKPLKQLPAEIDPELPFMVRRKIALANKKPLDSDDEADQQPEEDATAGWGAKSEFYDGDDYEDASEEGEAEEEEKEARKLQVRAAKMVSADDYLAPTVSKKSKQPVQATVADDDDDEDAEQDGVLERIERNVQLLSAEEKLRIVRKDSPELEGMLRELNEKLREVKDNVQPLLDKARAASSAEVREQGVSFLELKYHLLLAYCLNVSFYLLLKTEGKSVRDHPVVEQLLRIRAYLEKIKPIEAKLKYQLDKLLKSKPTEKSKKKAKKAVADDEDEDQDMRPRIGEMADDDDEADVGSNRMFYFHSLCFSCSWLDLYANRWECGKGHVCEWKNAAITTLRCLPMRT